MNLILRCIAKPSHISTISFLIFDVRVIQHLMRNNIIPKLRDWVHIALLILNVIYFVTSSTYFNLVDPLICYIDSLSNIKYPNFLRKPNLALDHLITFIMKAKYDISFPIPHDTSLTSFSNHSFHTIYG